MTNQSTPVVLSDEKVAEIEARFATTPALWTDVAALCQTVRAQQDLLQLADYAAEEFRRQAEQIIADVERERDALRDQLAQEQQQRGLVVMSALINFVDWLNAQGVLVTNVPERRAEELRGKLVLDFLKAHSEGENYFKQADDIAERLGKPFKKVQP